MDRSDVLTLIKIHHEMDDYGVLRPVETYTTAYCNVRSVTRDEFFAGGRNGLNPALRFVIFAADYHGESLLEYKGDRYSIYRTYVERDDQLELYTERKGGTNG